MLKLYPYIKAIISDIQYKAIKLRRKGSHHHSLPLYLKANSLLTKDD